MQEDSIESRFKGKSVQTSHQWLFDDSIAIMLAMMANSGQISPVENGGGIKQGGGYSDP